MLPPTCRGVKIRWTVPSPKLSGKARRRSGPFVGPDGWGRHGEARPRSPQERPGAALGHPHHPGGMWLTPLAASVATRAGRVTEVALEQGLPAQERLEQRTQAFVQRLQVLAQLREVADLDDTTRGSGGFGHTRS